jgi:hypothetical protein
MYINSIEEYTEEELRDEELKLLSLLGSLTQEYMDRKETITLVHSQLTKVRNRLGHINGSVSRN